jgi:hypothetical protein
MLGTLGFKLDEGIITRMEKIDKFSNQAKGSLELIIDYLLMKRSLLGEKVKKPLISQQKNDIKSLIDPKNNLDCLNN